MSRLCCHWKGFHHGFQHRCGRPSVPDMNFCYEHAEKKIAALRRQADELELGLINVEIRAVRAARRKKLTA